jgi:hypothetical protein
VDKRLLACRFGVADRCLVFRRDLARVGRRIPATAPHGLSTASQRVFHNRFLVITPDSTKEMFSRRLGYERKERSLYYGC